MAKKHTHKYERRKLGKNKDYIVYACVLPDCTHYLERSLAKGMKSICWKCGNVFTMTMRSLTRRKPVCNDCLGTVRPDIAARNSKFKSTLNEKIKQIETSNEDLLGFLTTFVGDKK